MNSVNENRLTIVIVICTEKENPLSFLRHPGGNIKWRESLEEEQDMLIILGQCLEIQ